MILQKAIQVSALALMALGGVACGDDSSGSSSGSSGSGTVTTTGGGATADTTSPAVSFSATALTVSSGGSATSTVTATDSVGVTSGPIVSCTNGGSFAGGTFTAPSVTIDTTVICTATASDAAGNSGSANLTVNVTAPVPSFSPASLTVASGGTGTVIVPAGSTVNCTNGGSFSGNTFTAPAVTTDTVIVCTITDAAGNVGAESLSVTVSAPVAGATDTEAPTVSFSPAVLTVASGSTGVAALNATDNVALTTGPTVTCTNGGLFSGTTFTAPAVTVDTTVVCTATASDAAGNAGTADLTATVTAPLPTSVIISGKVTFDHVPFNTSTNALNYNGITQDPVPGVTVQALDSAGTVLESTTTDGVGDYSFTVDPNTDIRIRALAELVQTSGAQWDVRVIDNTSSGALYALQGGLSTSGAVNTTRDLNARSGWGGSSYTSTRQAGPFAILAPVYESIQRVVAVDADVLFPPARFNWSVNNSNAVGDLASGEISTSFYGGNGNLFILGDASGGINDDTDEYDEHVVIHEWGHYFEDLLSRSDSIGGSHSAAERLDPRLALGEGFGNALSGMMTDDPFYRDSFGSGQARGFEINVEANNYQNEGWFNEGSVQSILYDIFDSTNDGADTISAGFAPIYNVLTSASYTGSPYFVTIFNFLEEYRANNAGDAAAVNALASGQDINGTDATARGETNTGNVPGVLPLYRTVAVNGGATNICLDTRAGTVNNLGNRPYLVFNVTTPGAHTLRMVRTSGTTNSDPDFLVHRSGTLVGVAQSGTNNVEVSTVNLTTAGQHVIDASDFENGTLCFDFTISR